MAEIWIEGRVDGEGAALCDVTLSWKGVEEPPRTRSRRKFTVITDAGDRVEVDANEDVVVAPTRTASGPWRELQDHVTRPTASKQLHRDGWVELEGTWVAGGERVAVRGAVTDEAFVDGTGGPREVPDRRVSAIRAIVIGVGDDARADAEREHARRDQAAVRRELTGRMLAWIKVPTHAAAVCAALMAPALLLGAYGTALYMLHLAVVWTWSAVPVVLVPGGAVGDDDDEVTRASMVAGINTFVAPIALLMMPLMCGLMMDLSFEASDAMLGGILAVIIPFEMVGMLRGLIARPRAEPGFQIEVPRRAGHRIALMVMLVAILGASVSWMVVAFERDHDLHHQD